MKHGDRLGSTANLQRRPPFLLVGVAALLLLGSAAVPIGKHRKAGPDPTTRAKQAYQTLQDQMAVSGEPAPAEGDSASGIAPALPLQRNLFQPAWGAPASPGAPAAPGAPPALSGIFIYGATREAILNGRRVREGDRVGGYQVLEIAPDGVQLQKGKKIVRLQRGEKP